MKMPDLATTGSEIRLIRWLVEPGQQVQRGQPLVEIETDKAISQVECIATGRLKEVRALPESLVGAGELIAILEVPDKAGTAPNSNHTPAPGQPSSEAAPALVHATPPAPAPAAMPSPKREGIFARNRAAAAQRITGEKPRPVLSSNQSTVGRRLQLSKQTIPHFYLQTSANAEAMMARRSQAAPLKIVWDAFFVAAAGRALREFERLRWRFEGEDLVTSETDAVGVAVEVRGELYVVVIASPASKAPAQISEEIRAATSRLDAGDLAARALQPATLTVSNLGGSHIESFAAIINPPETAILAVGRVAPQPVVREGKIVIEHRVALTLSVDHRMVNGKYAADFLNAIVRQVEGGPL